jgi:hypothetical protein
MGTLKEFVLVKSATEFSDISLRDVEIPSFDLVFFLF